VDETGRFASIPWLKGKLEGVLALLGVDGGTWAIRLVGDRTMSALHGRTMGDWDTTDVLTFDLRDGTEARIVKREERSGKESGEAVELDTVVCLDEARRRAKEMGHSAREELLLYCVHSLLHVQGYDDVTRRGALEMHRREDALLVAVGVGAVYGGERASRNVKRGSPGNIQVAGRPCGGSGGVHDQRV
jgi:probable rRNA maturation factor